MKAERLPVGERAMKQDNWDENATESLRSELYLSKRAIEMPAGVKKPFPKLNRPGNFVHKGSAGMDSET